MFQVNGAGSEALLYVCWLEQGARDVAEYTGRHPLGDTQDLGCQVRGETLSRGWNQAGTATRASARPLRPWGWD